jgi:type II secretory pathway component PulK
VLNTRGIALIIVLAIVAILSVLVIEFSYSVWVDMYLSANYLSRTQAIEAAKAGVEYAIYVLRRDEDTNLDWLGEPWAQPLEITIGELVPPPDPEEEDELADWYEEVSGRTTDRLVEPRVGGTARVLITDEERRFGVNSLVGAYAPYFTGRLERLIDELNVPYANVNGSELVEQMVDWTDDDDDGSWEYVYETLTDPYMAMNRPFTSVHELRLLADMTDALLYGTVPYPDVEPGYGSDNDDTDWVDYENRLGPDDAYGLISFVHCQQAIKVNVNTAPREVLTAFFDDSIVADEIMAERQERPFSDTGEESRLGMLVKELGGEYDSLKHGRCLDVRSQFFRIESIGEYRGVRVKVTAVVLWNGRDVTIQCYRIENAE